MEINPKLVKGLSGAELHVSAIYRQSKGALKIADILNESGFWEMFKKL